MKDSAKDEELGLHNPYSKVTCFTLYLYSLELGTPPLYSEANRVARDMDLSLLKELGPFLRALHEVTYGAEYNRDPEDKIKTGEMIEKNEGGIKYNIAGSFLLWRGAGMK